jgi:hypothetical protein
MFSITNVGAIPPLQKNSNEKQRKKGCVKLARTQGAEINYV